MEFSELGEHCALDDCKVKDFLPFKCDLCGLTFCREHRTADAHLCSERGLAGMPQCPICSQYVFVPADGNLHQLMDEHIQSGCKKHLLDRIKSAPDNSRCAFKSCRKKELVTVKCKDCRLRFCLNHRHPQDHLCASIASSTAKSGVPHDSGDSGVFGILEAAAKKTIEFFVPSPSSTGDKSKSSVTSSSSYKGRAGPRLNERFLIRAKLKSSAVGDSSVPELKRVYFPVELKGSKFNVWFDRDWIVRKAVDKICKFKEQVRDPYYKLKTKRNKEVFANEAVIGELLKDKSLLSEGEELQVVLVKT